MNGQIVIQIVGFVTSTSILVLGIIFLSGFMLPPYVPENFRILLGVIMVVYAVFRITMNVLKFRKRSEPDEE